MEVPPPDGFREQTECSLLFGATLEPAKGNRREELTSTQPLFFCSDARRLEADSAFFYLIEFVPTCHTSNAYFPMPHILWASVFELLIRKLFGSICNRYSNREKLNEKAKLQNEKTPLAARIRLLYFGRKFHLRRRRK